MASLIVDERSRLVDQRWGWGAALLLGSWGPTAGLAYSLPLGARPLGGAPAADRNQPIGRAAVSGLPRFSRSDAATLATEAGTGQRWAPGESGQAVRGVRSICEEKRALARSLISISTICYKKGYAAKTRSRRGRGQHGCVRAYLCTCCYMLLCIDA